MDKKSRILLIIGIIAMLVYVWSQSALRSAQAQMDSSREQAQEHAEQIAGQAQQLADTTRDQAAEIAARVNDTVETAQNIHAPQYCFRNSELLNEHFEKHGKEMGFGSPEEYELAAAAVITNPDALHKTEAEDGDDVYYIEETNEFVVVSTDGYIRTYFNPSSGKDYFDRQ